MKEIEPVEKRLDESFDSSESVMIDECTINYVQDTDTCQEEGCQLLKVQAVNNGLARFVRITTGEEGWSFSDIDDLIQILKDFKKRVSL